MFNITYLECTKCGAQISANQPCSICPKDGGVLYVRYNLKSIKQNFKLSSLASRPARPTSAAGRGPGEVKTTGCDMGAYESQTY